MSSYSILIGLSLAVILSYVFNLASRATRIPSVLLLLLTGIGLRQWAEYQGIDFHVPKTLLEIFGIIGLIMIVLEGALDLRLSRDKVALIRRSFFAAALMLVAQAAAIGGLLHWWLGASWQTCLLNAVPLVVISSAIAIPSVASLTGEKQEFIVYESTFSDILGIMLFNFVDQEDFYQSQGLLTFGRGVSADYCGGHREHRAAELFAGPPARARQVFPALLLSDSDLQPGQAAAPLVLAAGAGLRPGRQQCRPAAGLAAPAHRLARLHGRRPGPPTCTSSRILRPSRPSLFARFSSCSSATPSPWPTS